MLKIAKLKEMKKNDLMGELKKLRQEIYDISKEKMLQKYKGDIHRPVKLRRQIAKIKYILSNLPTKQ